MDHKSKNAGFTSDRKLTRRNFFLKTSLFAGAAAVLGLAGEGFLPEAAHAASNNISGAGAVPLYRLRHNGNIDHFYTTNPKEKDDAVKRFGYTYEGIQCYVFATRVNGSVPLYRLRHNGKDVDHFYTTSPKERDNAVKRFGYTYEGIQGYVFTTRTRGSIPLYRLRHDGDADHFYTTNPKEKDDAIKRFGYTYEGVAAYVWMHR